MNIGIRDLKKLRKIAKQTKCKIKYCEKKDFHFCLINIRREKYFWILLLLLVILLAVSSNFIWNIDVVMENNEQMDNIYQDVENSGLSIGKLKSQINTKEIINNIRLNRDDIAWMGIELKGTKCNCKSC